MSSRADLRPVCEHEVGCITCGDTALPLEVLRVDEERGLALCADERGRRETVEVALVDGVRPGERLLVHAGAALQKLEAGA
jgi:hydrogenase maturation factor